MRITEPWLKPPWGVICIDVLIALIWLVLLTDAYFQGRELPGLLHEIDLPEVSVPLMTFAILIGSLGASALTFWQRKNIMEEMPVLSTMVGRVFGQGAYARMTHRLRPVCASILSSLILAVVGCYTTHMETQSIWSYAICLGALVFAGFMFVAYLASKKYPPALR